MARNPEQASCFGGDLCWAHNLLGGNYWWWDGLLGEWHYLVRHLHRCFKYGEAAWGWRGCLYRSGSLYGFFILCLSCVSLNVPIPYAKVPYLSHQALALVKGVSDTCAPENLFCTGKPRRMSPEVWVPWLQLSLQMGLDGGLSSKSPFHPQF